MPEGHFSPLPESDNEYFDGQNIRFGTVSLDTLLAVGNVQSSNYLTGVSGWLIEGNGNAEFQNVVVRGTLNADDITTGTLSTSVLGNLGSDNLMPDPSFESRARNLKLRGDYESNPEGITVDDIVVADHTSSMTNIALNYVEAELDGGNVRTGQYALELASLSLAEIGTTTLEVSMFGDFPPDDPAWVDHGLQTFEGEQWYFHCYLGKRGNPPNNGGWVRTGIFFYDIDGVSLNASYSGSYQDVATVSSSAANWTEFTVTSTAPAGAVRAVFAAQVNAAGDTSGNTWNLHIEDVDIRRRSGLRMIGDLQSSNFSTGSAGWQINESGDAEFNDVTIRGRFETATGGNRIVIDQSVENTIYFYTGDASEDAPGRITVDTNGSGSTRTLQVEILSPEMPNASGDYAYVVVRSASNDGSTYEPGVVFGGARNGGGAAVYATIDYRGIRTTPGTAALPSHAFSGDSDTGMYQHSGNTLGFASGGGLRFHMNVNGMRAYMNGTTGQPAFHFSSSTNTGVYYNGLGTSFADGGYEVGSFWASGADRVLRMTSLQDGSVSSTARYNPSNGQFSQNSSTIRNKMNVRVLSKGQQGQGLDLMNALTPKVYNRIRHNPENMNVKPELDERGLIAEEVAVVAPHVSVKDADGEPWSVAYDLLIPDVILAIQELSERVEALE